MGGEFRFPEAAVGGILREKPRNGYSPQESPNWEGLLAVGLGCLTNTGFVPRQLKNIPDSPQARRFVLADGDLLVSRANTRELVGFAGRYKDLGQAAIYPDLMMRLRPDTDRCLTSYLELVLRSESVRRVMRGAARGTSESMVKISASVVEALRIPLPSVEEQQRIVTAHATFDRRIAALERALAKQEELAQSLIERMLRELGGERESLATVCDSMQAGVTLGPRRQPHRSPTSYLRVANVRKGWIDSEDVALLEATPEDHPRYELFDGDVLVVEGHADPEQIGRCAVVRQSEAGLLYQNHLFRLRFRSVMPDFAALWLNSEQARNYWKSWCATSSGLYTINSKLLADVPFPCATELQQQQVVDTWRKVNRSVEAKRSRVAKLRVVQQAVTEDLLSGRRRVAA